LTDSELLFERGTIIPELQRLLANSLRWLWEAVKLEFCLNGMFRNKLYGKERP